MCPRLLVTSSLFLNSQSEYYNYHDDHVIANRDDTLARQSGALNAVECIDQAGKREAPAPALSTSHGSSRKTLCPVGRALAHKLASKGQLTRVSATDNVAIQCARASPNHSFTPSATSSCEQSINQSDVPSSVLLSAFPARKRLLLVCLPVVERQRITVAVNINCLEL